MKVRTRRRLPNDFLGKQVLGRHRDRRSMPRPRVALILRRSGTPATSSAPPRAFSPGVAHYQFALHVHLSRLGSPSAAAQELVWRVAVLRTLAVPWMSTVAVEKPRLRPAGRDALVATEPVSAATSPAQLAVPVSGSAQSALPLTNRMPATRLPREADGRAPPGPAPQTRAHAPGGDDARAPAVRVPGAANRGVAARSAFAGSLTHRRAPPVVGSVAQPAMQRQRGGTPAHGTFMAPRGVHPAHAPATGRSGASQETPLPGREPRVHASGATVRDGTASALLHPVIQHANGADDVPRRALYSRAAPREFVNLPPPVAQPTLARSEPRPVPVTAPPAPQIDVARLSDDVYRHIERRIRIERERRGL